MAEAEGTETKSTTSKRPAESAARSSKNGGDDKMGQSFAAALRAAQSAPDSDESWDHVEELADTLQRPDEVAAAYREVLDAVDDPKIWGGVARRAGKFFDEWYGDDPDAMQDLLLRVLAKDRDANWAFERLTVVLTRAERWDELLALYDRVLDSTTEPARRKRLLSDAASVAKDFAQNPERAVDYMQLGLQLDRGNDKLAAAIERLLERQERWSDLVELWKSRLDGMSTSTARQTRLRIATTQLDHVGAAEAAVETVRQVLDEMPGQAEACQLLERVLSGEATSPGLRMEALSLLRTNYEAADRPADVVAAVERAIEHANDADQLALRREAGARLAILDRDEPAMGHYAALLEADPTDADARRQLRILARRAGLHSVRADALVRAAGAAEDGQKSVLLSDAAHAHRSELDDADRAIDLYRQVVDLPEGEPNVALQAAHHLNELLAATQRAAERLDVLERLADLESATVVRRMVLGDAGALANELGDEDRALSAYQRRLDLDESDAEALDATIDILDAAQRWEPLVEALRRRANLATLKPQRRADLVRVAVIQDDKLGDAAAAIDTWLAVKDEFGEEPDAIAALDRLMAGAGRHAELAELLDDASSTLRLGASNLLSRLGELYFAHLSQPDDAVRMWAQAVAVEPRDARARQGLRELCDNDGTARDASGALARAFRETGNWSSLLELVDVRVDTAQTPREGVEVLREAARLHEEQFGDLPSALTAVSRAFVLDPADPTLEDEVARLAEDSDGWQSAVETFAEAAFAARSQLRTAQLKRVEGKLREERLDDPAGAVQAFASAAEIEPNDLPTQRSIIRASALAGTWSEAATAVVNTCRTRELTDDEAIRAYVSAADARGDWDDMARSMESALVDAELPADIMRDLEAHCARWHKDRRNDLPAAEAAARRAVAHSADHLDTLNLLAEMQRTIPEMRTGERPSLAQTLLYIDQLDEHNLDALAEAGEIAVAAGAEAAWTREVLTRVNRKAARLLTSTETVTGQRQPDEVARWAIDRLVERDIEAARHRDAIATLRAACDLPWSRDTILDFRVRTARLYVSEGDRSHAIDLYRQVLEERSDDIDLVRELADLCAAEGRALELVKMRGRELELTNDVDRRLELRLEMSKLVGEVERIGGRVESLLSNLEEKPGHPVTVETLSDILRDKGRESELADILTAQAQRLEELNDPARAAALWTDVATLVEQEFSDVDRAIAALARVVSLASSPEVLDTLARLYLQRSEPGEAATVLRRRLESTEGPQRVPVLLRLGKALVQASQPPEAITALTEAFEESPKAAEVRKLLIKLLREQEHWAALAATLSVAAEHVSDPDTILAYAREASEIYGDRLETPDKAVSVLERAHELSPDDRNLKSRLAEGLRVASRLDEARALLTELIAAFGRRRSPQRAAAHMQLARVAHAQGDTTDALDQLEKASDMDTNNPAILKTLAEMAREADQLDRSERAYRALLMQVRRRPPSAQEGPASNRIGPAEVFIELSRIAASRGDESQAEELRESALEAMAGNDEEGPRLSKVLRERGDYEMLRRVLDTRLEHADAPRQRASMLGELAKLQAEQGQDEAAFDSSVQAIEADPGQPELHELSRSLAGKLDRLPAYVEIVENILDKSRRVTDVYVRCELLLRLAEAMAFERGDHDKAQELIDKARELEVREVDVLRAAARVAGFRGDREAQLSYLEQLTAMGEEADESRADAYYRMAEVYLADEDTVDKGIASLNDALESTPRYERAAKILGRATESTYHGELLALYEKVARATGDAETIVEALSRRANHPDTDPETVREAVEFANNLDRPELAETLMLRAVDLSASMVDSSVGWALLGLARRRRGMGDLPGAVKWLCEAVEAGEEFDEILPMASELAEATSEDGGDLTLAVKVYEALLERDPGTRVVWEPLADLYRKLGELSRLQRLVEDTLDTLHDPSQRNSLRLQLAQTLLQHGGAEDDVVDLLNNVLLEAPENQQAQTILAELLERTGREDELMELLNQQLMAAQERKDADGVVGSAVRLGQRQAKSDPSAALMTLRGALDWAPENQDLLRTVLSLLEGDEHTDEKAEILERLIGLESGDSAAQLAEQLAALHASAGDENGELRALVLGYRRAPGHDHLRSRLEQAYESRGDYRGLAQMLIASADGMSAEQASDRVALLRQAAQIHRELLSDPETAADILERAHAATPDDADLALELAGALSSAGKFDRAGTLVSALLDDPDLPDSTRLGLLRTRADLRASMGDVAGTVEDLEAAYPLDQGGVLEALSDALEKQRQGAQDQDDPQVERGSTLRLAELAVHSQDHDMARALLSGWIERERKDVDALRMLRDVDRADGQWEAVAKTSARLVAIETGEPQAQAALTLFEACSTMGSPGDARAGLEHARRKQPENRDIRDALLEVYEAIGADAELARLLQQAAAEVEDAQARLPMLKRVAQLFVNQGETEAAMPVIQEVLELAPDDTEATLTLVDAHLALGQVNEADSILDNAVMAHKGRRSPELAVLHHRKARSAAARGDAQLQLEMLQAAFGIDKNNGMIAAELADLAEVLEDWDLAIRVLRTITLLDGDCPITRVQAFLRQAQICYRRGDRQRAVLWARKAKHESPDDPEVAEFLAALGES